MRVFKTVFVGFLLILPLLAQHIRRTEDDINREETAYVVGFS
jgi:hypothetical protein